MRLKLNYDLIADVRPHGLRISFCEYSFRRKRSETSLTRTAVCVVEISRRNRLNVYCGTDIRSFCGKRDSTRIAV